MFYSQSQKQESQQKKSIENILEHICKLLWDFFALLGKCIGWGMYYVWFSRRKIWKSKIHCSIFIATLYVPLLLALYIDWPTTVRNFFFKKHLVQYPVMEVISTHIFSIVGLALYFLVCGIIWIRRKNFIEKGLKDLGFKRNDDVVALKKEEKLSDGQWQWVLKNQGFSIDDFKNQLSRLEHAFNILITDIDTPTTKQEIVFTFGYGHIPVFSSYKNFYEKAQNHQFGIGHRGPAPLFSDWNKTIHMLIGGETGGGKSSFLRQLITRVLEVDQNEEFYLIDLKEGLEFSLFRGISQVKLAENFSEAHALLTQVDEMMSDRLSLLKRHGVMNVSEYNRIQKPLSHVIIVIDECAELFFGKGKDSYQKSLVTQCQELVQRIARLSRATGIHLILATQKPNVAIIDGQTKTNLGTQLCFRTNTDRGSISVLGHGGAVKLSKIPGRALFKQGADEMEVQIPYLKPKEAREILKNKFNISEPPAPMTSLEKAEKDFILSSEEVKKEEVKSNE